MEWHEKILRKHGKEIVISAISLTVFVVLTFLWSYFSGESFVWTKIEPFSYPSIGSIGFYSALAFRTLGAFLFSCGLWLFLFKISGSRREYNRNKNDLWKLIMLGTFGLTVLVFWIVNSILSILFNILMIVMHLLPPAIVTILLLSAGYYSCKKYFPKLTSFVAK